MKLPDYPDLFVVHLASGAQQFIKAHYARVTAEGALTFTVRKPLWRRKDFLTFAPNAWRAFHAANSYWSDDTGISKNCEAVDADSLSRALLSSS